MSPILTPRSHDVARRAARRLRMGAQGGIYARGAMLDAAVSAAGAVDRPGLAMPEPEDRRQLLVSSALSALLHLLAIVVIAIIGYYAKHAVEEVIPVVIFNEPVELPGSNEPSPVPVPRMISAPIAHAVPLAMEPSNLAAIPAPVVEAPSLDTTAPSALDLAEVTATPLAAQADISPTPSAADIRDVQPLDITAADLVAPKVEISGPTETTMRTPTDLAAPQAFAHLADVNSSQYKGAVTAVPTAGTSGAAAGGSFVATGVSAEYLAAGGAGGDPNAIATVPCLQSAFVVRYQNLIDERTTARFEIPYDSGPEDFVRIRIAVDQSGSLVTVELVDATDPRFADNAMAALRGAAPFPPLNDNNRCLTEKNFILTFNYPEEG
ncbi:MAG: energy transducer TonB [bacterium]|nr:energy transducer TonB [bacterium]